MLRSVSLDSVCTSTYESIDELFFLKHCIFKLVFYDCDG
jgi:hypothetical protein